MSSMFVTLCWVHLHRLYLLYIKLCDVSLYLEQNGVVFTHPNEQHLAFEARTIFDILIRQVHGK